MPIYHQCLANVLASGLNTISCTQIAQKLNLTPIQVRKDLAVTGITGKPKIGYNVLELQQHLADFLGWNNITEIFLVGVGHLGNALLNFEGFTELGFKIIAGFDCREDMVGQSVNNIKILPISHFKNLAQRLNIHIGIITTPASTAQEVADLMVASGIEAILNFTNVHLTVPDRVIVQNENMASSLAILSKRLAEKKQRGATYATK